MVARSHPLEELHNKLNLGGNFQFISIQNPDDAKNRTTRRLARSHAVKKALENKRKLQQKSGHNFRIMTFRDNPSRSVSNGTRANNLVLPTFCLSGDVLNPFQMLAVESSKLQGWLSCYTTRQAAEPVFSIADELVLQNFRLILRAGLDDTALLNATMLTFVFAVTGAIDQECLVYQGQALSSVRGRMGSMDKAASESTIGAILLLAGIEARLSMPFQVQLHMRAIQQLLDICRRQGVYLTDGIKRAIFWQDLNSSIMTGSSRIVDHTTFAELQWTRDRFSPDAFILPPGFQKRSYFLTKEFVEVLKDVHGLQCIRDYAQFGNEDVMSMAQVDNHQASIQSRLVGLSTTSSFLACCHLAAYLCSTMLRCKIWRASIIPSHLSLQLLNKIQQANENDVWDNHPEVLAWLLYIGGAFAPTGNVRSDYVVLLRTNHSSRFSGLYESWPELLKILKQFIWSEKAFLTQVKAFWEEFST